jgi:hypothetical protein
MIDAPVLEAMEPALSVAGVQFIRKINTAKPDYI